jgi:hypothetical protein
LIDAKSRFIERGDGVLKPFLERYCGDLKNMIK